EPRTSARTARHHGTSSHSDGICHGAGRAISTDVLREERRFVYVLRSVSNPDRHYVGTTSNVRDRLCWHNEGPSGYTVGNRPWELVVAVEFSAEREAIAFERYLKSGSGRAFAKRHFGHQ